MSGSVGIQFPHGSLGNPADFQPAPGATDYQAPAPTAPSSGLGDFAKESWIATEGLGQGLLGAVSLATRKITGNPDAVQYVEDARNALADHIASQVASLSPEAQQAMHASIFGNGTDVPTPGQVGWGKYLGARLASAVPTLTLAGLGSLAGPAAPAILGGVFGATGAGDAYEHMVEVVDKATPDQLNKNPVYAAARAAGMNDLDARKKLAGSLALPAAALQGGTDALAGLGLGGVLTRGAVGGAERSALAALGIGAAEGAATMGAQGAADTALQQRTENQAGVRQGYDTGAIERAGASGAIGGLVLGGLGGALHSGGKLAEVPVEDEAPIAETPAVGPDETAALAEVLPKTAQPEAPPETPAGPTEPATSPTEVAPEQTKPLKRFDLVKAIRAMAGDQAPPRLAGMKLAELRTIHDELQAKAQAAPPAEEAPVEPPPVEQPAAEPPPPVEQQPPAEPPVEPVPPVPQPAAPEAPASEPIPTVVEPTPEPTPEPVQEPAPETTPETAPEPAPAAPALSPAAARRALRKQQMAQPGVPMKPTAAVIVEPKAETIAEPEPAATPARPQAKPRAAALTDLAGAMNAARHEVTPLKKGADVGPILDRILREITQSAATRDDTEHAVHAAVADWGKRGGMVPGTKTRRVELADRVMRLMTGKPLPRNEALVRQLARAPKLERSVVEKDGAAARSEDADLRGEEIEAAPASEPEAEASEESTTPAPSAPKRAPGSNTERIADDLLHEVLAGTKTAEEAHAALGVHPSGRGRKRKIADFASHLENRIAEAEKPERQVALGEALAKTQNDKSLTPQAKSAATAKISRELALTDPDTIQRMRDALHELRDPVGAAIARDVGAPLAHRRATRPLMRPGASRYVRAANDPRLNDFIARAMHASERNGVPYTLHDALRAIVAHTDVRAELTPLHALARQLLKDAPDLPVMTPEHAIDSGALEEHGVAHHAPTIEAGDYQGVMVPDAQNRPQMVLLQHDMSSDDVAHVPVLLHEALHTVTAQHIDRLLATDPEHRDLQALRAIREEIHRQAAQDVGALGDAGLLDSINEVIGSPHEVHTYLMTEPALQAWTATRTASPEFRAEMSRLGFAPRPPGSSIWRYFTDWVRRAVGLPAASSASEMTLFDHLLSPLQDTYNSAAAQFDRQMSPGTGAGPLARMRSNRVDRGRRYLLEHLDAPGIPDKVRRATLIASPTDAIVDRYRGLFTPSDRLAIDGNPLEHFRTAVERAAHITKTFHDTEAKTVNALLARLTTPEQDAIGRLMTDATLAEARLGNADPKANAHLKSPEEKTALAELQSRYRGLSEAGQRTYQGVRAWYARTYRQTRDARLDGLLKATLPDLSDAAHAAIVEAARSPARLDRFLKDADNDPVAAAFADAWDSSRKLVKGVLAVHRLGFVQGDYFPLRRFGDYVIRYGSKGDPNYGVELFEKRGVAEARRAELAKANVEGLSQVLDRRESHLRDLLPDNSVVEQFENALHADPKLSGQADDIRDLLKSILLESATRSERARTVLRRKGVKGAATDARRILASEFLNTGYHLGRLAAGPDRAQALAEMRMVTNDLAHHGERGQQIIASQVTKEMEQRVANLDDGSGIVAGMARRATSLGFVQSIMSVSHMLTNTIEAHMNSTSLIGARHGFLRTDLALARALAQVSPKLAGKGFTNTLKAVSKGLEAADWNLAHVARDRLIAAGANAAHMRRLFDQLDQAGLIDHTMVAEMHQIANPRGTTVGKVQTAWQRFMDMNGAGAHAVDVANKAAVAKAAFDLELAKTGSVERAAAYAVEQVRRVSPNYNRINKSRISTSAGPLGRAAAPLMQFKQYGLHMYSLIGNLVQASLHGATREERWEARKAFAGVLFTHAAMAGALTLIADPLRLIGGAYDAITGAPRPHNYQNDVRGFLADTFGPQVGEIIARGLPHLAGFDIHRRVGLANMLELPDIQTYDAEGIGTALLELMTGAAAQDAAQMTGGALKVAQGDVAGGVTAIVPRPVRDMMKAHTLATQGVMSGGKLALPAAKLSPLDPIYQGLGFQPSDVTEFREGREAVVETRMAANDERTRLEKQWLAAAPGDRRDLMAEIQQYNVAHPYARLTVDMLLRQLAAQRKGAPAGSYGLRMPKRGGAALAQAGAFANAPR